MKGSAVAQGWKALAAKINNQVPLGPKESNRLLTALTSSFRKHLDEVHPSDVLDEGTRPVVNTKQHKPEKHALHSSAALADKHLASVLTNPLLAKSTPHAQPRPAWDEITAAAEIDNGADPLEVLESYQEKDFATPGVALVCLRRLRKSIKHLPHEGQVAKVQETQAGKRILSWLWNGKQMQTQAFADNQTLQEALVWYVVMEGQEELIWQWLHSDVELPLASIHHKLHGKQLDDGYMWKSNILRAIIKTKLGSPYREAGSADAAIEAWLRAVQSFHEENSGLIERLVLTKSSKTTLETALTRSPGYPNTSPFLYDRFVFIHANQNLSSGPKPALKAAWDEFHRACLNMWHPTKPSADLWYTSIMRHASEGFEDNVLRTYMHNAQDEAERWWGICAFVRAAEVFARSGNRAKVSELLSLAREIYPNNATDISRRWRKIKTQLHHDRNGARDKQKAKDHNQDQNQNQNQRQNHDTQERDWLSHIFPAPT
ncbi:hypothetical protein Q7P37_003542 [Cladosporium fusiforme]